MKTKNTLILIVLLIAALGLSWLAYYGTDSSSRTLSARNIKRGLDLSGGVYIVYQADKEAPTDAEMDSALSMIRNRLDTRGWNDAEVSKEEGNRLRVEIPGVENAEEAIEGIGQTAQLTFRNEEGEVLVDGSHVSDATVQMQNTNTSSEIVVALDFDSEGAELFRQATADNIGKRLVIWLDETMISAPTVNSEISDGSAVITGGFSKESASELADLIRAGSLPFKLDILEYESIGATLGEDSLNTSLFAGVVGISLVLLFMLVFYRVSGFAADWALVIYLSLELIILNGLNITLTLPGIAGIVLSVGMAVDANVIIFERIKEELNSGRTLNLALQNGFSRAFPAIFDSNITTLIACGVLFWLGTGPIKGFAQTLAIGIILSMFTALVITRFIIKGLVAAGAKNPKLYGGK